MSNILVTNIIEEDKITINLDLQDGSFAFPTIDLSISGDIELNPLVIKLTSLLELDNKLEITYIDSFALLENESKFKLIKETLDDIYDSFNSTIIAEEEPLAEDDDF